MMDDRKRRDRGTFERAGEAVGGFAGRMAGKATDVAVSLTGALFNSVAGVLGSWWSSPGGARRAAQTFTEEQERACRDHFEAQARRRAQARGRATADAGAAGGTGYAAGAAGESEAAGDEFARRRPLYQFGHVAGQNPEYQNRSFSEVEPELREAWEQGPATQYGRWEDVREYVDFGYRNGGAKLGRTGGV